GRARHRDDVRLSRYGQADLRCRDRQRLQPRTGRVVAGRGDDHGRQFYRRSRLCLARPAGFLSVRLPLLLLGAIAAASFAGPLIAPAVGAGSDAVELLDRFSDPSLQHPLGTDELGRDVLLRLLEGGRVSLVIGITAAITAAAIGTAIGLAAGYLGG